VSPHQTIAVAVRLFAIWLAAYALRTSSAVLFGGSATPYGGRVGTTGLVASAIVGLLTVAAAVLLWFFPLTAAKKLLSAPAATPDLAEGQSTWLAMGCALIGLWLLASVIPSIARDALYFYLPSAPFEVKEGLGAWFAYRCIEVAVALYLIFGSKGFVKVFWWTRTVGTKKTL